MKNLITHKCIPCEKGGKKMTQDDIDALIPQVPGWDVVESNGTDTLKKSFTFKNFKQALVFTNQVGDIAEEHYHHPTLITDWGKVTVIWVTHKIKGLHINDFSMAAKTDAIYDT